MIKLERPLVVFDVETTGTSPAQDRIVQLAAIKIHPDGKEEEFEWMVNPECSIPEDARALHGITNEDVMFASPFKELAYEVLSIFKGCDLSGYNATKFDVPLLANEFKRAGMVFPLEGIVIVDSYVIYRTFEPHTLSKAYEHYCHKTLENAHSALADTRAAWEVLKAQAQYYEQLPNQVNEIVSYCSEQRRGNSFDDDARLSWVQSELAINFGKYKGSTLRHLVNADPGYLEWIMSQDFSDQVKNAIREALKGKFLQKQS